MMLWHEMTASQTLAKLSSDEHKGLSSQDAGERLKKHGPNQLKEKGQAPFILIFIEQFKDFMIIVLMLAAAVAAAIGELKDAGMIVAILILNALLGASQQYRASQAIAALRKMSVPQVNVMRDGEIKSVSSKDLIPGDIVLLEAGTIVPADMRILSAFSLMADESALTGESHPVEKKAEETCGGQTPVADRCNLVFSGTNITYGRGKGVVVETGMTTQIGHIAEMIEAGEEEATPLQKRFSELGKWLAIIALLVCTLVFVSGVLRGEKALDMFLTAISLAVAAIPEGLPAVIAVALSLGAYRLAKKRAIIRKLPAVETLGSTNVICSDKTGTLTQNKMTVVDIFSPDEKLLLKAATLCNDATASRGDPTERALVVRAGGSGVIKAELEKAEPRVSEIPFDSARKLMTTLHRSKDGKYIAYMKGALEVVLNKVGIDPAEKEKVLKQNEQYVGSGKRVLGFAYRKYETKPQTIEEKEFTFVGICAMADPPRPEVFKAVERCREAGIRPIMITGDHKLTALSIAREIGITGEVMVGSELEGMTAEQLRDRISEVSIFARVNPEHKVKIVEALRAKGLITAMTGDGVNDAPALKRSDIGVAMGQEGTDVAREAADMVLTDDNFATIVSAVEEGRGIYENIRKFIRYMLSTNSGEIFTMFFSILLRLPLPLLPIHILWVNLVTDGLPAVALSVEPVHRDVMKQPPRPKDESIFAGGLLMSMLGIGILMAAGTLGLFFYYLGGEGIEKARTVAFTTLSLLQMAHVLNCRSLKRSLFSIGIFSNRYLILAIVSTLVLQAGVIYLPILQGIFHSVPLNLLDWGLIGGVSLLPIVLVELRKRFAG